MAASSLICEGDHLVLDVNGEKLSFVQKLKATGRIRVGKYMVPAAPLVGAPYGALFEVTNDGKALQRVLLPPADEITRITETEKNNSGLFDRNTENQKLTQEEIEELKKSGKAGSEIIQALCSNSATFQNKTEFSQDKYRKRKAKKYLTYLTVRKPCARILCEAYYDKGPERVNNLRHDSLAVMLSVANVAAGAKVLVAEQCAGVVTAAAVERLGGVGSVCALQLDERPAPLDAVRQMNLSYAQRSVLFTAPAGSLLRDQEAVRSGRLYAPAANGQQKTPQQQQEEAKQQAAPEAGAMEPLKSEPEAAETAVVGSDGALAAAMEVEMKVEVKMEVKVEVKMEEAGPAPGPEVKAEAATAGGEAMELETAAAAEAATAGSGGEAPGGSAAAGPAGPAAEGATDEAAEGGDAGAAGTSEEAGQQQRRGGGGTGGGYGSFLPRPAHLRAVLSTGFDSCLIATPRVHPTAALAAVWPLLAPSASFAVFSPWPQPLAEAMSHLQSSRNAVLLQLQESWLRPYQVLPARTHPHMSCSGTGGFVLSGIKIIPPDTTPLEQQLQFLYPQYQAAAPSGRPVEQQQERAAGGTGAAAEAQGGEDGAAAKEEDEEGERQEGGEPSPSGGGGRGRGQGRGWGRNSGNNWRGRGNGGGGGRGRGDFNRGGGRGGRGRDGGGGGGWKRKAEGGGGDTPGGKRQAT